MLASLKPGLVYIGFMWSQPQTRQAHAKHVWVKNAARLSHGGSKLIKMFLGSHRNRTKGTAVKETPSQSQMGDQRSQVQPWPHQCHAPRAHQSFDDVHIFVHPSSHCTPSLIHWIILSCTSFGSLSDHEHSDQATPKYKTISELVQSAEHVCSLHSLHHKCPFPHKLSYHIADGKGLRSEGKPKETHHHQQQQQHSTTTTTIQRWKSNLVCPPTHHPFPQQVVLMLSIEMEGVLDFPLWCMVSILFFFLSVFLLSCLSSVLLFFSSLLSFLERERERE